MKSIVSLMIMFAIASTLACDSVRDPRDNHRVRQAQDIDFTKDFVYFKDPRTNLCFMECWAGSNWGLLSNVPCTPEVLSLIENPK